MVDTHCHLDIEDYENLEAVINKMENNIMIASGYDIKTSKNAIDLSMKYDNIFASVGIHPSEVKKYPISILEEVEKLLVNNKVVALGEIGLDFYWDKDNKEIQKEFFIEQIKLAQKYKKPIVIHSRDANYETLEILKKYLGDTRATMHCYSGSYELAKEFKKLGLKFGIGGVLTFKNSSKIKEVVENLELDDLLLETDSPYLTPEPFRGKKNEPCNIIYVAQKIAELKKINLDKVLEITTNNAISMFDLKK